jgi:hypothetical protein
MFHVEHLSARDGERREHTSTPDIGGPCRVAREVFHVEHSSSEIRSGRDIVPRGTSDSGAREGLFHVKQPALG